MMKVRVYVFQVTTRTHQYGVEIRVGEHADECGVFPNDAYACKYFETSKEAETFAKEQAELWRTEVTTGKPLP